MSSSKDIRNWVQRLQQGEVTVEAFLTEFPSSAAQPTTAPLGDAQIDLDRKRRCGFAEVVYAEGKSNDALVRIFTALLNDQADVLATRMSADQAGAVGPVFPAGNYNPVARTFRIAHTDNGPRSHHEQGFVPVVSAGTSDRPVAEEAQETVAWMGVATELIQDIGVAGPHRLLDNLYRLAGADAIVVVAGMEGALPSVLAGHVPCPVIAVPTSVGYGASLGGIAALLGMLNSCAANVAVVNIDAGFKGGYVAGMIATAAAKARKATLAPAEQK